MAGWNLYEAEGSVADSEGLCSKPSGSQQQFVCLIHLSHQHLSRSTKSWKFIECLLIPSYSCSRGANSFEGFSRPSGCGVAAQAWERVLMNAIQEPGNCFGLPNVSISHEYTFFWRGCRKTHVLYIVSLAQVNYSGKFPWKGVASDLPNVVDCQL